MGWGVPRRPKISTKLGNPNSREGSDGDIQIKGTALGAKLWGKWSGRWWDVPLSKDGVTKFGVTDSNYLSIDRDSVDIFTNKVKVATFGSTTTVKDINLTGKITVTSAGTDNICIGTWDGGNPDQGEGNVVIGVDAGNALNANTDDVVLIGKDAGKVMSSAGNNADHAVAIGPGAMGAVTEPYQCTAIGHKALYRAATSIYNVAIGYQSLYGKDTSLWAKYNVAVGTGAMMNADGDTDSTDGIQYNTALGHQAMRDMDGGNFNTAIGHAPLLNVEGDHNVGIGNLAGNDITTGSDNICIGDGSGVSANDAENQIAMGEGVQCSGDDHFTFGDGADDSDIEFGETSITAPSDVRYKENVETSTAGLSFVNDLRPVIFKWKLEGELPEDHRSYVEGSTERYHNNTTNHGFIAQEVKEVIDSHSEIKDGFKMWAEDTIDGRQRIGSAALIPVLTKAVQELSAKLDTMQTEINTLKEG